MSDKKPTHSLLSGLNIGDSYQRKARFLPGLITILAWFPLLGAIGLAVTDWLDTLLSATGLGLAMAFLISHLASAAGNRAQRRLYPHWPHDAPTNRWLHPSDESRSRQQKAIWLNAIHELTGLDILAASNNAQQIPLIIEDAVSQLRARLWKNKIGERLHMHNIDYGFARNLLGLRTIWLPGAFISCAGCWALHWRYHSGISWAIIAALVLAHSLILSRWLPRYTHRKAEYYAESFLSAVLEMSHNSKPQTSSPCSNNKQCKPPKQGKPKCATISLKEHQSN